MSWNSMNRSALLSMESIEDCWRVICFRRINDTSTVEPIG